MSAAFLGLRFAAVPDTKTSRALRDRLVSLGVTVEARHVDEMRSSQVWGSEVLVAAPLDAAEIEDALKDLGVDRVWLGTHPGQLSAEEEGVHRWSTAPPSTLMPGADAAALEALATELDWEGSGVGIRFQRDLRPDERGLMERLFQFWADGLSSEEPPDQAYRNVGEEWSGDAEVEWWMDRITIQPLESWLDHTAAVLEGAARLLPPFETGPGGGANGPDLPHGSISPQHQFFSEPDPPVDAPVFDLLGGRTRPSWIPMGLLVLVTFTKYVGLIESVFVRQGLKYAVVLAFALAARQFIGERARWLWLLLGVAVVAHGVNMGMLAGVVPPSGPGLVYPLVVVDSFGPMVWALAFGLLAPRQD